MNVIVTRKYTSDGNVIVDKKRYYVECINDSILKAVEESNTGYWKFRYKIDSAEQVTYVSKIISM